MRAIQKYFYQKRIKERTQKRRIFYTLSRQIDTGLVQLWSHGRVELECMDKYVKEMETQFENKWKDYEQDLQKYLVNTKEYDDWMWRTDEFGKKVWFNIKTWQQQYQHPGKEAFLENRKYLFKLAVAELKERKQEISDRRDFIYQREWDIMQDKAQDLKNLRLKMMF